MTHNYPLKKIAAVLILFVLILFCVYARAAALTRPACQYPERSTNTATVCDNSDPCDPADAAKGGSGTCKQLPVSQPEPTSQNTETVEKPVETVHNSCLSTN